MDTPDFCSVDAPDPGIASRKTARPRLLLADDHPYFLEYARRLLGTDYEIIGAVNNGLTALKMVLELRPDLVVLDIEMPGIDGIRVAHEIRDAGLKPRILFLTVNEDEDYITAARAIGSGYVLKCRMGEDLRKALKSGSGFFVSQGQRRVG